jgi:hypothetical protein
MSKKRGTSILALIVTGISAALAGFTIGAYLGSLVGASAGNQPNPRLRDWLEKANTDDGMPA